MIRVFMEEVRVRVRVRVRVTDVRVTVPGPPLVSFCVCAVLVFLSG